jgi:hypothetical protein
MKVSFFKHTGSDPIVVEVLVSRNTPTVGTIKYDVCCRVAESNSVKIVAKDVPFLENDIVHPTYNVCLKPGDELFGRVKNKALTFEAKKIIIT